MEILDRNNSLDVLLLKDALTDETRKERRNLLAASIVAIIIAWLNIVPEKISALGIDLKAPQQVKFLLLTAVVVAYFLVMFFFYAMADRKVERHPIIQRARDAISQEGSERTFIASLAVDGSTADANTSLNDLIRMQNRIRKSLLLSKIRSVLDFWFPITFGGLALLSVLIRLVSI
jgi:hypothetical protein